MTAGWWRARCLVRRQLRPTVRWHRLDRRHVEAHADQQFQAGLFCGSVACHSADAHLFGRGYLCPASRSTGPLWCKIPAPGTENDDHNPPRIAPRNLFDLALGHDNLFHGDKYKWSAQFTVINLTNKYALYNFLSTFSGTHYVTPRAITAQIGFHF